MHGQMTPLAAAGAVLVLINILSPLHKPVQVWLCKGLHSTVPQQLSTVAWAQQYTHPVLDSAVFLSAATVTIEFYLTMLPILAWCGFDHLLPVLVGMLGLQGWVVFGIKDLLESPRPADCINETPKDVKITIRDYSGDIEDGIPSAHCSGSVLLLLYIANTAAAAGYVGSEWKVLLQLAVALWVAWIAFGRLYLGVHSPIDLASGCLVGLCMLDLWQTLEQPYINWLASSEQLPLHVLLLSFVLMRFYPMPSRYTSCYQYVTAWCGGWCGVVLGYRHTHPIGDASTSMQPVPAAVVHLDQLPTWIWGLLLVLKVVLGLLMVAGTKVVVKQAMLVVLQPLFRCVPTNVRCLWQPPVVGDSNGSSSGCKVQQLQGERVAKHGAEQQSASQQAGRAIGAAPCELGSSSCRTWALRHAQDGMAVDVVATAKFVSYTAVGWWIITMNVWWQRMLVSVLYASSTA